ncbi:MAG: response regulator [Candidatus Omnitrophica bacterium]|nr:response regulator [Candidatus Omnitrophota bacterium]
MKKKIMIIDDEENFALLLKIRLEYSGSYEVMAATEAKDIIERIHVFKPDVILLDLLMPGIGGLDVCEMLNNDPFGQAIPIIVVSGLDKSADKIEAFKLGITDYFVKPVDDAKLIEAIEKAIKSKSEQS